MTTNDPDPRTETERSRTTPAEGGDSRIGRRRALALGGLAGATTLAGCLGIFETRSADQPPVAEDRPDAVYVPTHFDAMSMVGMEEAGDLNCALSVTRPHRFWLVTGTDREEVTVQEDDDVHLMASLIEPETGMVPPSGNVEVTIARDGETVDQRSMWTMLSQRMGFHFGDNIGLDGAGTYEVEVTVSPIDASRTGDFRGMFEEPAELSFTYEFDPAEIENLGFTPLEDQQGQRGAVRPMDMEMLPIHQLPPAEELPGEYLGEIRSGDGVFALVRLPEPPAGIDGSGPYLAVSARTPHNRFPIPFMAVDATVESDGETAFDGPLNATIHPELDYHYGAPVDALSSGDTVSLSFGAPPQVARHEGYETAFFEFEDGQLTLE